MKPTEKLVVRLAISLVFLAVAAFAVSEERQYIWQHLFVSLVLLAGNAWLYAGVGQHGSRAGRPLRLALVLSIVIFGLVALVDRTYRDWHLPLMMVMGGIAGLALANATEAVSRWRRGLP
jgi:hypothetical protein